MLDQTLDAMIDWFRSFSILILPQAFEMTKIAALFLDTVFRVTLEFIYKVCLQQQKMMKTKLIMSKQKYDMFPRHLKYNLMFFQFSLTIPEVGCLKSSALLSHVWYAGRNERSKSFKSG